MSITSPAELNAIQQVSDVVAQTLRSMIEFAKPGMNTKELDEFGGEVLKSFGARSAPSHDYDFPGWTCISVGKEFCHGIPSTNTILEEGDLINIDVSAELNGYYSDNGASFVLGNDVHGHQKLVDASKAILTKAISNIKGGMRISDIGHIIETEAKKKGFRVIKNLTGHGIGKKLHEAPSEIANYRDKGNQQRFKKNSVVAIETFISTHSNYAVTLEDGWTMVGDKGGYMAQHEHTIIVTDKEPIILTKNNLI